jgi:hypothetical protein
MKQVGTSQDAEMMKWKKKELFNNNRRLERQCGRYLEEVCPLCFDNVDRHPELLCPGKSFASSKTASPLLGSRARDPATQGGRRGLSVVIS